MRQQALRALSHGHACKALVLKSKIEKPFPLRAVRETILKNLPQERGLARAAHTDNRDRFVSDSGDVNIAPRELGHGLGERVDDFPAYEVAHMSFSDGQYAINVSVLKGQKFGKVFMLALALDVVYQIVELRFVYPGEAVIVAFLLAIVPYLILRGLVTRLMSRK